MSFARPDLASAPDSLPQMPSWVTSARAGPLEDVAFLSGAALATLHLVVGRTEVPHALLRERLSLTASEACMRLLGRPERGPCCIDSRLAGSDAVCFDQDAVNAAQVQR